MLALECWHWRGTVVAVISARNETRLSRSQRGTRDRAFDERWFFPRLIEISDPSIIQQLAIITAALNLRESQHPGLSELAIFEFLF